MADDCEYILKLERKRMLQSMIPILVEIEHMTQNIEDEKCRTEIQKKLSFIIASMYKF